MIKDDQPYLRDILDRIKRIERYITCGEEAFFSDTLPQDGVIRSFEVIGEAVKHLSIDLTKKYSGVPWKDIAGMRDKVIHDYLGVDAKLVWKIAQEEIPVLKQTVEEMLLNFEKAR